jgi:hypothetical protein
MSTPIMCVPSETALTDNSVHIARIWPQGSMLTGRPRIGSFAIMCPLRLAASLSMTGPKSPMSSLTPPICSWVTPDAMKRPALPGRSMDGSQTSTNYGTSAVSVRTSPGASPKKLSSEPVSVDSISSDVSGFGLIPPALPYIHSSNAVHLYCLMAVTAGDPMASWSSVAKMGQAIGLSLSTTKRTLHELESAGTIVDRDTLLANTSSGYYLPTFPGRS